MGLVYLIYSAYFLSSDFVGMMLFVNLVLSVLYFILGFNNLKSVNEQIQLVKNLLLQNDNENAAFQQSIRLKLKMLR